MLTLTYKSLSSNLLGLAGNGLSTCGSWRSFSSSWRWSARRTPTEAEVSNMSYRMRWHYRKMEDPAFREKRAARSRPQSAELHATMLALPESPERARYLAVRRAGYRRSYEKRRDIAGISKWLLRISDDRREAFDWKTHRPVVYSERVHKTCSTCLSSYMHGSKLW